MYLETDFIFLESEENELVDENLSSLEELDLDESEEKISNSFEELIEESIEESIDENLSSLKELGIVNPISYLRQYWFYGNMKDTN